jgi:site-specific DNA-methyltransferase (adenine-specific)
MNYIYFGENLSILKTLKSESVDLIYIDPPFNTGKIQSIHGNSYKDKFQSLDLYLDFLRARVEELYRILKDTGSFYFHIDYRYVHYCKVMIDEIFGIENFMNEIIWAYDYGGRSKKKWSAKHDNILFYVKNNKKYYFNYENVERLPYLAPNLVTPEKRERGKTYTDVWWNTIVHTTGKERVNYPTQKPVEIIKRIIKVSCPEGGVVLDAFAGSGTTGQACLDLGGTTKYKFILIDSNQQAIETMKKRFWEKDYIEWYGII